jgi:hypothetical protein
MRIEAPVDWMAQCLIAGPDDYIAVILPEETTAAESEQAAKTLRRAWGDDANFVVIVGDAKVVVIERTEEPVICEHEWEGVSPASRICGLCGRLEECNHERDDPKKSGVIPMSKEDRDAYEDFLSQPES